MNISVSDDCIACGACESLHPDAFEVTDGKSNPKQDTSASLEDVKDAENRCPQAAISAEESTSEDPSLDQVLQEAKKAGVEGAEQYIEMQDQTSEESSETPNAPDNSDRSQSSNKGRGKKSPLLLQVLIVAGIVLATGYVAMV